MIIILGYQRSLVSQKEKKNMYYTKALGAEKLTQNDKHKSLNKVAFKLDCMPGIMPFPLARGQGLMSRDSPIPCRKVTGANIMHISHFNPSCAW